MRIPAIKATSGVIWAAVMTMKSSSGFAAGDNWKVDATKNNAGTAVWFYAIDASDERPLTDAAARSCFFPHDASIGARSRAYAAVARKRHHATIRDPNEQ